MKRLVLAIVLLVWGLALPAADALELTGGVTSACTTANRLARLTSTSRIGCSLLSDDATNVTLTSGQLVANTTNAQDLGLTGTRWRTGYFGTSLELSSAGFLGLGAAAGRLVFTDAATDTLAVLGASLGVGTATPFSTSPVATVGVNVVGAAANENIVIRVEQNAAGSGGVASLQLRKANSAVNERIYDFINLDGGTFLGRALNDAETVATSWLTVERTGITIDSVAFPNSNVGIGQATATHLLDLALGTLTAQKAGLNLTGTWNSGATTFHAIDVNITRTSQASASTLLRLRDGATDLFKVSKDGDVTAANALISQNYAQVAAASYLEFAGRSLTKSSADGIIELLNNASTGFTRLNFGGTTSSFPAWARSAATLQAKLADDSAFATVTAKTLNLTDATNQLVLDSDGTFTGTITMAALGASRTWTLPDLGGTIALTANNLSVFAATTSAQLAGVISDEQGSGALVFATSPTLTTPNIGAATGTSLALSGLTANSFLYSGAAGALTTTVAPTNGQLLIGSTGVAPVAASLTAPAAGLTITGGAGTITFALANDLSALEGLGTAGIGVRTGADAWTTRTVTGTANQITVTNGDGVSGNPTLSTPQDIHTGAAPQFARLGLGVAADATELLKLAAGNIVLDTVTGTKFGTATTQKLAFFNATPIVQPGATVKLNEVLSNLGLRAAGADAPLDSGAITASGDITTGASNAFVFLTRTKLVAGADGALSVQTNSGTTRFATTSGAAATGTQVRTAQATAPTCTTNCGTSPAISGSDTAMIITLGTGSPASPVTITFNGTWSAAPACIAANQTTAANSVSRVDTTTTTAVVYFAAGPTASDKVAVTCLGVAA